MHAKRTVRPPEIAPRFYAGTDYGTDGVVLARSPAGKVIWFPGHAKTKSAKVWSYKQVQVVFVDVYGLPHRLLTGGRVIQERLDKIFVRARNFLKSEIFKPQDLDANRKFTTVVEDVHGNQDRPGTR